jgi:uncharacterized protein with HEPN domain
MSLRVLVYVGHMLDMARKAVDKTSGLSRDVYDNDENLRLALTHLVQIIGEAARPYLLSSPWHIPKSRGLKSSACATKSSTTT